MNAVQNNLARTLPRATPTAPAPHATPSRRRRTRRTEAQRLTGTLCGVGAAAAILITYVFGCATATQQNYKLARLRARLAKCQSEHRLLEGQVAELQQADRVLFLAKQQGMQRYETLQYVRLLPEPAATPHQQVSARP